MKQYIEALIHLEPDYMVFSLIKSNNDEDLQKTLNKVRLFKKNHPKVKNGIINAVLLYLLKTFKGRLPNYRYMKKTLLSFIVEHHVSTELEAFKLVIDRFEYFDNKDEIKQEKKAHYKKKNYEETQAIRKEIEDGLSDKDGLHDMLTNIAAYSNNN